VKNKHYCPECRTQALSFLKTLQRWWCSTCDEEIDVEATIKKWANQGVQNEKR